MRVDLNYNAGFYQIFPFLYHEKENDKVILIGFGRKNIAFVFDGKKSENTKKENDSKKGKQQTEFVFIWYKKMNVGTKTFYTQPFRTKITADNKQEAIDKVTNMAMKGMRLCIHEEKDFKNSDLAKLNNQFDEINKSMEEITKDFKYNFQKK